MDFYIFREVCISKINVKAEDEDLNVKEDKEGIDSPGYLLSSDLESLKSEKECVHLVSSDLEIIEDETQYETKIPNPPVGDIHHSVTR